MSNYVENYGFTKTIIKNNGRKIKNELKWISDYDGKIANIEVDVNDNGKKEFVSMQLDNNELMNLLGIQPIEISLDRRLTNDFLDRTYQPIALEGALRKTRKHKSRHRKHRHHKKRKTHKSGHKLKYM